MKRRREKYCGSDCVAGPGRDRVDGEFDADDLRAACAGHPMRNPGSAVTCATPFARSISDCAEVFCFFGD